jgi:hypothetical protein
MMRVFIVLATFWLSIVTSAVTAQDIQNNPKSNHGNKFEQLGTILPRQMSIVPQVGHPAQNTGSNVRIIK